MLKLFAEITKIDEEQRMVYGYASTAALDSQGEIIKVDAIESALPDYMKFANIREMHTNSAVGVAKEASMDEKGLYIGAKVVDESAWQKVKEKVYKGFSIGGRATARDETDKHIITAITLSEISLVDRPANPEAVFDVFKAETPKRELKQTWNCGVPGHEHVLKADALKCIDSVDSLMAGGLTNDEAIAKILNPGDVEMTSYSNDARSAMADKGEALPDGSFQIKNKDDLKNAIQAYGRAKNPNAAKKHIIQRAKALDAEDMLPPEWSKSGKAYDGDVKKGMYQVAMLAQILSDLDNLRQSAEWEQEMEGDDSDVPNQLKEQVNALADTLVMMASEEGKELTEGDDVNAAAKTGDMTKAEVPPKSEDLAKMISDATHTAIGALLEKNFDSAVSKMTEVLDAKLSVVEQRLKIIEDTPVRPHGTLRSVSKAEDISADHQHEESKPMTPGELIKAAHLRGPDIIYK